MKLIEMYIDALENKDYEKLASLFTKDGQYCDYSAHGVSQQPFHIYGKEAISMFFRNEFFFRNYSITEPTILNDTRASFIASFGGYNVMAIATLQQVSGDGHIRRLTVRQK